MNFDISWILSPSKLEEEEAEQERCKTDVRTVFVCDTRLILRASPRFLAQGHSSSLGSLSVRGTALMTSGRPRCSDNVSRHSVGSDVDAFGVEVGVRDALKGTKVAG